MVNEIKRGDRVAGREEEITKFVSKKDREKEIYLYIDRERKRDIYI